MINDENTSSQVPDAAPPDQRFAQWFLGTEVPEKTEALDPATTSVRTLRLRRARLAMELADRALDDVEPLKSGPGAAVAVSLLREAIYWALAARHPEEPSPTLVDAFDTADRDLLISAAGDDRALEAVRAALVERTFVETAELRPKVQAQEARQARAFAGALVASLEVRSALAMGWRARLALAAAIVFGVALLIQRPWKKTDLAAHGSWHTSTQNDCDLTFGYCSGRFVDLLFHTLEEDAPWAELDLGRAMPFTSIQIHNRADCCKERAIPLVVQASDDRVSWKELGRKTSDFDVWDLTFPTEKARYLRFLVERRTMLHLKSVSVQ